MILRSFSLFCLILFLIFLSACEDQKIDLVANDDVQQSIWQEKIAVNFLDNDNISHGGEIVIETPPEFGELVLQNDVYYYVPNSRGIIRDNIVYYIKKNNLRSQDASHSIHLVNALESVSFLNNENKLKEKNQYSLRIKTLFPVIENTSLSITRLVGVDGKLEHVVQNLELDKGKQTFELPYSVSIEGAYQYHKEHTLTIFLSGILESKLSLNYSYFDVPDPESMYLPRKSSWYNKQASDSMVNRRALAMSWLNYPEWQIPEKPSWDEDPYKNNSWLLYYHSLFWLFAYEYAYEQDFNERYLSIISDTILDYLQTSPRSNPSSYMSWNDHTVAFRMDVISYFYTKYFRFSWSDAQKEIFYTALDLHALELRDLLDKPIYERHNHGLIHALSLFNYAYAFPIRVLENDYAERSHERMIELFNNMVNTENGVSIEQAASYQLVAIKLFSSAHKLIADLTGDKDPIIESYLKRMIDFASHLTYPDGSVPSFGNTNYKTTTYLNKLEEYAKGAGIESSFLSFLLTNGEEGTALNEVTKAQIEGYVILRPDNIDETVIFADFGKTKFSHGNHDAMSFTLWSDNHRILIDSGGPYIYDSSDREYFNSRRAHNTLVINGMNSVINDAVLYDAGCKKEICFALGQLKQQGSIHTRLILSLDNEGEQETFVFDYVDSNLFNNYELIYHFPINAQVTSHPGFYTVQLSDSKSVNVVVKSNELLEYNLQQGETTDRLEQGWVTPQYAKKVPAPVLNISLSASSFWSLTEFLDPQSVSKSMISVDNEQIEIKVLGRTLQLEFSEEKVPKLIF
ncbi:heparinase II/III domain-containing protein [Pseudoalteromonas sp. G4]|uniref:heparinase II/III domain-containing protein n=1 Tax=Pseudoalteromonas sp. G4 TaxID=2992761 RepID=UPI00237D7B7F|nr:heparinase II/III family protein [Pseudoalteromonas sp. G4]MDE3272102.1 heparinase II/III family protein [Pseudoalteromonas sp. G4]